MTDNTIDYLPDVDHSSAWLASRAGLSNEEKVLQWIAEPLIRASRRPGERGFFTCSIRTASMLYLLSPVALGGLSPSDIAKRMGVTKQAVHKHINDLRDILGIGYVRSDSAREKMRHAHLKSLKRRKFIAGLKKKRSDVPGGGRESPKKKGE